MFVHMSTIKPAQFVLRVGHLLGWVWAALATLLLIWSLRDSSYQRNHQALTLSLSQQLSTSVSSLEASRHLHKDDPAIKAVRTHPPRHVGPKTFPLVRNSDGARNAESLLLRQSASAAEVIKNIVMT